MNCLYFPVDLSSKSKRFDISKQKQYGHNTDNEINL